MTPEDAARTILLDFYKDPANRPVLLAAQYLKVLDVEVMHQLFPGELVEDDPVAVILASTPVRDPDYARSRPPLRPDVRLSREEREENLEQLAPSPSTPDTPYRPIRWVDMSRPHPRRASQARSEFARWVEGERDYSPGIAGAVD